MYANLIMGCLWLEICLRFIGLFLISWILSEVVLLVLALWRTVFQVEAFLQNLMRTDTYPRAEDFEE